MAEMRRGSRAIPDIVKHRATEKKVAAAGSSLAKMRMRRAKMGPLKRLTYEDDPLGEAEISDDPIDGLNDAIGAVSKTVAEERAKVRAEDHEDVGEEGDDGGEIDDKAKIASRQAQDIKQWRDAKFYTVLVFDSGGQCQAFLDQLKVKCHLTRGGDLFLDGRHVADALGFTLPPPEYKLKSHRTDVKAAITKTKVGVMGSGDGKGKGKG